MKILNYFRNRTPIANLSLILLLFVPLALAQSNEYVSFCRSIPSNSSQPLYISGSFGNPSNSPDGTSGICVQDAECALIPSELSDQLRQQSHLAHQGNAGRILTDAEMLKQIENYSPSITWRRARLACAGAMTSAGPECPSARRCQLDSKVHVRPARIANPSMDLVEVQTSTSRENEAKATDGAGLAR